MKPFGLDTKFIMPAWWVKAFEAVVSLPLKVADPFDLSFQMGLIPALNRPELDALGSLLHKIQSQLLNGSEKITIRVTDHMKSSPYTGLQQRFAFDRILQLISATHLASYGAEGDATTRPLFRGFRIDSNHPRQEWNIQFEVESHNRELIFGYIDPYAELLRTCEKQERNFKYCGSTPPLKLWKPVWLELQGHDQIIFLRLEKTMQWEQKLLRLDGVIGDELASLCRDLIFSRKRSAIVAPSQFSQTLRILRRLGRRLIDHGLLLESAPYDYCSFPEDLNGPVLTWQLAPHYLAEIGSFEYENAVACDFDQKRDWMKLIAILAGPKEVDRWRSLEAPSRHWQTAELDEIRQAGICAAETSYLFSLRPLFIELFIRSDMAHPLSLYQEIWESPYRQVFEPQETDFDQRFQNFQNVLAEEEDPQRALRQLFAKSLANPKNQSQAQVLEHLVVGSELISQRQSFASQSIARSSSSQKEQKRRQPMRAASNQLMTPDEQQASANLKQEAIEELSKMRKFDQKKYQKLKEAYLQTLDPEKKKIIIEVRQRLHPEVFDDHLKQSLVKFMLENPRHWRPSSYA